MKVRLLPPNSIICITVNCSQGTNISLFNEENMKKYAVTIRREGSISYDEKKIR